MFKFKDGRGGTGYKVLTIFSSKLLKCDCHIIKYEADSFIAEHKDPAPEGYVHKRTNIVLGWKLSGGIFNIAFNENYPTTGAGMSWEFNDNDYELYYQTFYPSECVHSVTKVFSGKRYVLSFGRLIKSVAKTESL